MIKKSFLTFGILAAVTMVLFLSAGELVGGKSVDSPDGRYSLSLTRTIEPSADEPYRVKIVRIPSGDVVLSREFVPEPGIPTPPVRGSDTAIKWSNDSASVEIVFKGEVVCLLQLPLQ